MRNMTCLACSVERQAPTDTYCRHCGTIWPADSKVSSDVVSEGEGLNRQPAPQPTMLPIPPSSPRSPRLGPHLVLILAILSLVAFLVLDRTVVHVYSPDVSGLKAQIHDQSTALQAAQATESRDYLDVQGRIKDVDKNVQNALNTQPTSSSSEDFLRDARIASSLTVLSLIQAYGGFQSSASAAGKACDNYLLLGIGSLTDCGFQHVNP